MCRTWWVTTGAFFAATSLMLAQQGLPPPEPAFRVEVSYVEQDVRVVDSSGKFVGGLTRDDFELLEDGAPQKVDVFALVDIPFIPLDRPAFEGPAFIPIDPDVASNMDSPEGRFYLILLDDYHVVPTRAALTKQLVRQFILENLGANDQAAILYTSGNQEGAQWFTRNRRVLLAAVDKFTGQKLRSMTLGVLDPRARQLENPNDQNGLDLSAVQDFDAAERMHKTRSALSSLRTVVEWMSTIRGRRKGVLYVTEGFDYNWQNMIASRPGSPNYGRDDADVVFSLTQDAISAATRGNVQIYPLDPRGLAVTANEAADVDNRYRLPDLHQAGISLEAELQSSQSWLRQLAEETGGIAITGTNDFTQGFHRIVEENSSYYVLGYYPSNEKNDGKLRTIDVKVKGDRENRVIYRKQYSAAKPGEPQPRGTKPAASVADQLVDAMNSPLQVAELGLRMTAMARKGAGNNAGIEVLVHADGKDLQFKGQGGTFNSTLSLSIGLFNKSGKWVTGEWPVVRLPLKPSTHEVVVRSGLRILTRLEAPAGFYQLRVAGQDSVGRKKGSLYFDLEVPDFSRELLSISNLTIASTADSSVALGKDPYGGALPGPPTALRDFRAEDELTVFAEVYDNRPAFPHSVQVSTMIKSGDGELVFKDAVLRSTEGTKGSTATFGHSIRVPLDGFRPGLYVLTLTALAQLPGGPAATRTIQFKVH